MLNGAVFKPLKAVFVWTAVFSRLAALFFYFALEKGFSIEAVSTATLKRFYPLHWSGFNRYIEAVLTATLKPINRHQQTYSQSFVMPLPKYKPKRQVTDTKCIWFHLGPLFLVFHYEVHTVVTNWNALQAEKQKQNSRRSQCCRVLIEMHFRLNTRRNRFIELS